MVWWLTLWESYDISASLSVIINHFLSGSTLVNTVNLNKARDHQQIARVRKICYIEWAKKYSNLGSVCSTEMRTYICLTVLPWSVEFLQSWGFNVLLTLMLFAC